MKILKITDGFVTNSSSYSGVILIAVRKGTDLGNLLEQIGIPPIFSERFEGIRYDDQYEDIEFDDMTDLYDILEAWVLLAAYGDNLVSGDPEEGENNPLRWFCEENDGCETRKKIVNDDLILLYSACYY